MSIARDSGTSLSEAIASLLRSAIGAQTQAQIVTSARTGLDVITLGRTVTIDDVRALDDE